MNIWAPNQFVGLRTLQRTSHGLHVGAGNLFAEIIKWNLRLKNILNAYRFLDIAQNSTRRGQEITGSFSDILEDVSLVIGCGQNVYGFLYVHMRVILIVSPIIGRPSSRDEALPGVILWCPPSAGRWSSEKWRPWESIFSTTNVYSYWLFFGITSNSDVYWILQENPNIVCWEIKYSSAPIDLVSFTSSPSTNTKQRQLMKHLYEGIITLCLWMKSRESHDIFTRTVIHLTECALLDSMMINIIHLKCC